MRRTPKVITAPALKTTVSASLLNYDPRSRSVVVGRRGVEGEGASGLLGKVIEQASGSSVLDYGVWVDLSYPHVIGVFGTRGTGKSFDLGVLAECVAGVEQVCSGPTPRSAVVFFDVQSQFWTLNLPPLRELPEDQWQIEALKKWGIDNAVPDNVEVWYPRGCERIIPSAKEFSISPSDLKADEWLAMLGVGRFSAMGQALLTILDRHGSETPQSLAKRTTEGNLPQYQGSTVDALRWRLQGLGDTGLIDYPGVDLDILLNAGTVSVMLLRGLSEELRALVVAVVTRRLADRMSTFHQRARVARRVGGRVPEDSIPDRLWAFLDEAHVIVPREGKTAATDATIDYVKRGRDAGLSLVFATQQPSAVDNRLMSQVDLTITHTLSFESDLEAAVARMPTRSTVAYSKAGLPMRSLADALRSLGPGEAVVADAMSGRIFAAQIRPRLSAHGGNTPTTEDPRS